MRIEKKVMKIETENSDEKGIFQKINFKISKFFLNPIIKLILWAILKPNFRLKSKIKKSELKNENSSKNSSN